VESGALWRGVKASVGARWASSETEEVEGLLEGAETTEEAMVAIG
jgi:hypothetical protein